MIYLCINGLFIAKYIARTDFPLWLALPAFALVLPALLYGSTKLPGKFLSVAFIMLSLLVTAGIVMLHRAIDPMAVQVDRWSAIDHFLQRLLQGEYPYLAQTHLGGYGSPFPFWNAFHLPFYWMGDVAIGMTVVVIALIVSVNKITQSGKQALTFLVLLIASPAFWYEVAVRSDLIYNFLLCYLILAWWNRKNITINSSLWITALVSGLMLSTRLSVIVPFFMYLFPGFIEAGWKRRFQFVGIAALTFVATFLPFMVWNFDELVFFEYNPFVLQTRQGSLLEPLLLVAMLLPLSLLWKRQFGRFSFYTGVTMVVFIAATFLHRMIDDQFASNLFSSRYDITYFSMSLPFLIHTIAQKINPPINA
jgi:hypothetical protein